MILLLIFGLLFVFLFFGVEIFASMGISGVTYLLISDNAPLNLVASKFVDGISSYSLLAIPFFMLVGELMNLSGMTKRLIVFSQFFIGKFKGGLAYAAVFVNMLVACISGSAPADCSAVSSVLIPEMRKEGYPEDFSAAINCCSSVLGPIIPPSIPLVFLAMLCNVSTGRILMGGIVPGVLMTLALLAVCRYKLKRVDHTITRVEQSWSEFWRLFKGAGLALLAPVIIIVGVFSGFVTITEVAMLAAFYVLIIGVVFYKTINLKVFWEAMKKTVSSSAALMALFGAGGLFSWFLAVEQVPKLISNVVAAMNLTPVVFLLIVNLFLLLIGMIMDAIPAITIFMPVLMPIATGLGIDPVHFGVVVVMNLMIGLLTPPVGALLYVESKISGVSFDRLTKQCIPYIGAFLVCLLAVTFWEPLSTWLPNLLMEA